MRFYSFFEKRFTLLLWLVFGVFFALILQKGALSFPDTEGYLDMAIYRSPIYPIFLAIINSFSGTYFNYITVGIQAILGFLAVRYLIITIGNVLSIPKFWLLILAGVVLLPYMGSLSIANALLSEALAYPLYLLVIALFLKSLTQCNLNSVWKSIPYLLILLLTRNQFLFLIPIGVLLILWITKFRLRSVWMLLAIFLSLPLISSVADKSYHFFTHGHFVATPWTGIHIITPAFFVADEEDFIIFENEGKQLFFQNVMDELKQKELNIYHLPPNSDALARYTTYYSSIANHTVFEEGKEHFQDANEPLQPTTFIETDRLTSEMTPPLIMDNLTAWFKLYVKNVSHGFGGSKSVLLYCIILLLSVFYSYKTSNVWSHSILLLVSATFGNIVLIAVGMHTVDRFTFYNDWVLFLIIFILLNQININPAVDEART